MNDDIDDVVEGALRGTRKNARSTSPRNSSDREKSTKSELRENPETDEPRRQSATALVDHRCDRGTNAQIDASDERGRWLRSWLPSGTKIREGCSERCELRVLGRRSAGNQRGCVILGELVVSHFSTAIARGREKGTALGKLLAKTFQCSPLKSLHSTRALAGNARNLLDGEVGNDAQHHDVALVRGETIKNGASG